MGGSCLFRSCSSSRLIRRDGPQDEVRDVDVGREEDCVECSCEVTRRDIGRPWLFTIGSDDCRTGGGKDDEVPKESPPSFDHSRPDDELGAGEDVREGGLLSKERPFVGSQLNPPSPVGFPNLCISSSYMRSCSARAIAWSLASSCSARVLKPSCSCW